MWDNEETFILPWINYINLCFKYVATVALALLENIPYIRIQRRCAFSYPSELLVCDDASLISSIIGGETLHQLCLFKFLLHCILCNQSFSEGDDWPGISQPCLSRALPVRWKGLIYIFAYIHQIPLNYDSNQSYECTHIAKICKQIWFCLGKAFSFNIRVLYLWLLGLFCFFFLK